MWTASRRLSAPMINKERSGSMEVDGGSSAACYDDDEGADDDKVSLLCPSVCLFVLFSS